MSISFYGKRHRKVLETFHEIQASGNPLTPAEIAALVAKRPERYAALVPYAAPPKEDNCEERGGE